MLNKFIFLSLFLISFDVFAEPKAIYVDGMAQLWKKECQKLQCGLPSPVSNSKSFKFKMLESTEAGSVSTKVISIEFDRFVMELQYYWVSKQSRPGLAKGYISIQQKFWQKTPKRLLSEFGQYRSDDGDLVVPIGYIAAPISGNIQYGVSFTKPVRRR